jgi:hypothetical protein
MLNLAENIKRVGQRGVAAAGTEEMFDGIVSRDE